MLGHINSSLRCIEMHKETIGDVIHLVTSQPLLSGQAALLICELPKSENLVVLLGLWSPVLISMTLDTHMLY